ncbi:MAG: MASE3 domain-containing protein [Candidatus Acetothermia bacterium]
MKKLEAGSGGYTRLIRTSGVLLALTAGAYLLSTYNYLLFHSVAELFSIVVAFGIFVVAWNSRTLHDNDYLTFIGIAFLFVGGIDLIHTLAYEGMGVFPNYGADLPTQLWIIGRYMESLSLLLAPAFFYRKLNYKATFIGYSLTSAVLLLTVFYWKVFPHCFVPGSGLTTFKVVSEYVISAILVGAILLLVYNRDEFDKEVFYFLLAALFLTVFSELLFTFYINVYGISNLLGHLFKIGSFYLIYVALIDTGFKQPHRILFRELEEQQEKLKALHDAVDRLQQQETEEELVQTAVEVAEDILEFDLCAIALVEGDYLVPEAHSTGLSSEEFVPIKLGEGIAGKAIQEGETIWVDDLRDYPDLKPTSEDFKSCISIPIGNIGNLQIVDDEAANFEESDLELAEILANHLYEELQRVRLEKELKERAIRDPLTGLYNRRYFNESLGKEVERCKRYEESLAFVMIDVNRFKEINDRYSHQKGDQVLTEVANLLKENVRDADTVVRYGGDEFLIMMPETKKLDNATSRLDKRMERWNKESDLLDFPLTLAMGISRWNPNQGRGVEDALKEADERMYEDKRE